MPSDAYVEHVRELLASVPDLRFRKMFGGVGVFSGELMFALLIDDRLHSNAGPEMRSALAAAGSEPFSYNGANGRTMITSYWRLPASAEDDGSEARAWARSALDAALAAKRVKAGRPAKTENLGPGPWDE